MPDMNDPAIRFGVDLKETRREVKQHEKTNRAKASIYAWEDPRLQKTAVVKKRTNKAATQVQRFIRACISHWNYYNQERIPLLADLEDCKRRRTEELQELSGFKIRWMEEAKFELEAQFSMPQEMFEKNQKLKNQIKQEIKEEEEAGTQLEKEILEENQRAKKLGREKHEISTQHTMARLDVEVPALEAEKMEVEEADEQFLEVLMAMRAQLGRMNTQIGIEERHKKRLVQTLARMLKALQSGGAKAKVLDPVKETIQQAFQAVNPAPPSAPVPAPAPPAEKASEPNTAGADPQPPEAAKIAAPVPQPPNAEPVPTATDEGKNIAAASEDESSSSSSDESTSTSDSSSEEEAEPVPAAEDNTTAKTKASMAFRNSTGSPYSRSRNAEGLRYSTGSSHAAPAHIDRSKKKSSETKGDFN